MHVAMYYSNNDVRLEEMPVPDIGRDEILMRVESSGICGSDVLEWYRRHKVPLVLGHEVSGQVEKAGSNVKKYKKNDRITALHHVPCETCHYCRTGHSTVCDTLRKTNFIPGGFSEYIKLSLIHVEKGIIKLPDTVSYDDATFVEPLACVIRGQRIAGMGKGRTVLVLGSGISGLLHISVAKVYGAETVVATDVNEYRLNSAGRFGADESIHASEDVPARIRRKTGGRLADIVIVCAAAKSVFEQALASVERGGTILIFSAAEEGLKLPLPVNELFWRNEITITSSYAGSPRDCKEALEWIKQKKVNVSGMITHRFPLKKTGEGFKLVAQGKESIKVIIKPHMQKTVLRT